jgi:hypothetical protein
MDLSKFKTPDWLKVGGALGFLIFGIFFDWAKISEFGFTVTGNNAFSYPLRGLISLILILVVGVTTFLAVQGKSVGKVQWPLVHVVASGISTLFVLLLVILGPDDDGFDLKPAIGLWLSLVAAVVVLAGSVMAFTGGGGNLKDLTDVNKLKGSFGGDSTPPPPPPPGA